MHPQGPQGAPARPWVIRARLLLIGAFLGAGQGALVTACSPTEGYVEIAWALIDQSGTPLYPDGVLADSCEFVGVFDGSTSEGEGEDVELAAILRMTLTVCDPECSSGCDDPECQVIEPTSFACNTARAAVTVPSRSTDYRFVSSVVAEFDGDPECVCTLSPECVQLPGSRERRVRGGQVTDLQVYQVVLDLDDPASGVLDLSECCDLPESCAP